MQQDNIEIDYDLVFSAPNDSDEGHHALESENAAFVSTEVEEVETEPIRILFPEAGSTYSGGESDGFVYRSVFKSRKGTVNYDMIKAFLAEEGYEDIPLPQDFEELLKFKLPTRNKQILLFEDNGYAHNPIKILFSKSGLSKSVLTLEIYNENAPNHLLRFHNKL